MTSALPADPLIERLAARLASSTGSPLYLQLADQLARAIRSNDLLPGAALPAERTLAERLGISRITVRKAVESLTQRGLIESRQGSGHFVRAHVELPLSRLTSFTEEIRARGRRPGSRWIERSVGIATPEEALALHLPMEASVARFVRLRLADDEVMAFERSAVPARLLPEASAVDDSLYAALERAGHGPVGALQYIRAINLDRWTATQLGVRTGTAALLITRHATGAAGELVEFAKSYYLGDRYDFVAELGRRR